jgi:hypothetical protein
MKIEGFQLRARYVKVADGAAFWRENNNLLKFYINDGKSPHNGMP